MTIKNRRILAAVILFAALLLLCFAGCQNNDYADIYETPGAEDSAGQATNTDDYSEGLLGDKPNAGSVFKNGKDFTAWKEIKKLGLDNLQIGDARVSKIHANVFVNDGDAKFRDMYELINKVKQTVYDKSKIILEEEIEIIEPQDIVPYQ